MVAFCPAEFENLEDMLDSHEFLLGVFVGGVSAFCAPPFSVEVFSVEVVLEKLGRCEAGLCAAGAGSFAGDGVPFCSFGDGDTALLMLVASGRDTFSASHSPLVYA